MAIVLLPAAYMGAYYAVLNHELVAMNDNWGAYQPVYRLDFPGVKTFFRPAHEVDRLIRPGEWEGDW